MLASCLTWPRLSTLTRLLRVRLANAWANDGYPSLRGLTIAVFVPLAVNGVEKDARAFRTKVVKNNGFDPQWNQTFDFPLTASELGIFLIAIYDKRERFTKDRLVRLQSSSLSGCLRSCE